MLLFFSLLATAALQVRVVTDHSDHAQRIACTHVTVAWLHPLHDLPVERVDVRVAQRAREFSVDARVYATAFDDAFAVRASHPTLEGACRRVCDTIVDATVHRARVARSGDAG